MNDSSEQQIINIKIPLREENLREEVNFYRELRALFREHDKGTEDIDFVIANVEAELDKFRETRSVTLDEERIIAILQKHPYFKNPGTYPVRLLTLLKYLKSKGINMHYADIDIYIDRIVQKLDGVKKVGRGLYQKSRG